MACTPAIATCAAWDGVYLMTYNQRTQQPLGPAEVSTISGYLRAHRSTGQSPVQVAVNGLANGPDDPLIEQMAAAGAAWWIEYGDQLDDYLARIRSGPPSAPAQ